MEVSNMRIFSTYLHRCAWLVLLVPLALVAGRANAQVSPLWDHYKVYQTPFIGPPQPGVSIILTDQFGVYTHQLANLQRIMNPVQKEHGQVFPINNPNLHYTWWRIFPSQPFSAQVTATNQFGDQTLSVGDGEFLLNPALKNQTGSPPVANHFKCYVCDGQPVSVPVLLTDQFDQWSTVVGFPRYFCNPVQKDYRGVVNPILDPNQHYICYEIGPEDPGIFSATVTDQFIVNLSAPMGPARYLCVPTYKTGVTDVARGTWGKLKLLYR
jgi:hypothetical protein